MHGRRPKSLRQTAWYRSQVGAEVGEVNVPLGVENAMFLEDFSYDGDGRIDGVGDDQDECLGTGCGDTNGQVVNDAGVDLLTVRLSSVMFLTAPTLKRSSL